MSPDDKLDNIIEAYKEQIEEQEIEALEEKFNTFTNKCPKCGWILSSTATKCAKCGYARE